MLVPKLLSKQNFRFFSGSPAVNRTPSCDRYERPAVPSGSRTVNNGLRHTTDFAQLKMALLTRIELAATRSTVEPRHQLGPGASYSFCNELEDQVGLEPTVTLRRRIKNPLPWPLGALVHDWRIRVVSNHLRTA